MNQIRKHIPYEEFDYLTLMDCLKEYARPRDKITELLSKGAIIRVKKGLYIFGKEYRRHPFSRELLANLIYGPSYVSLEYALSYYGIIPERVETITSVTCGKNRMFSSPIGRFTYWSVPEDAYRLGIDLVNIDDKRSFLMASREKALADFICHDRGSGIRKSSEFESYLFDNMRVDAGELSRLNPEHMAPIARAYRSRKVGMLINMLRTKHQRREVRTHE